jgi:hypothetical protein
MKDIIDVGNSVFDRLVSDHEELSESRTLFLYGITTGTTWFVLDSAKWITIDQAGIAKNFDDSLIEAIDRDWKNLLSAKDAASANKIIQQIKPKDNGPKDGDRYEFWKNEGPWREISL